MNVLVDIDWLLMTNPLNKKILSCYITDGNPLVGCCCCEPCWSTWAHDNSSQPNICGPLPTSCPAHRHPEEVIIVVSKSSTATQCHPILHNHNNTWSAATLHLADFLCLLNSNNSNNNNFMCRCLIHPNIHSVPRPVSVLVRRVIRRKRRWRI